MDLYPYQRVGAGFLMSRKAALLADDMGLGKTIQAIAACDNLWARDVVVVCPASVRENWKREFKKFSIFGIEPLVLSYDALVRDGHQGKIDVLILDEAHYLKNQDAKRTKAAFALASQAEHVFLLTGTPMPNHPAELWPMLRACAPETIIGKNGRPDSYWQFVFRYCKTKDNGFGIQIVGSKNLEVLRAAIAPFMLRRLKADVLPDLPPIRFDELFVEGRIEGLVGFIEAEIIREALEDKGVDGLKEIAPHVATLRRMTGLAKVPAVVEWVKDWLDGGGEKIVLFAHHREVIEQLYDGLSSCVGLALLTGSTTDRGAAIDQFQNNEHVRVFIGQIQAAGTGITLTAASDVLFVESSWVPAENSQAAMRVHRIGQKNACLIRFATLAGSIDEQIQKAVMRKSADIAKLLD